MKRVTGAAAMLLAGAVAPAAAADLYGGGGYGRSRHPHHHGGAVYGAAADGSYGERFLVPGHALSGPGPVVECPEPYIGRGLVYNVPPDLYGPRRRRGGVVTARY